MVYINIIHTEKDMLIKIIFGVKLICMEKIGSNDVRRITLCLKSWMYQTNSVQKFHCIKCSTSHRVYVSILRYLKSIRRKPLYENVGAPGAALMSLQTRSAAKLTPNTYLVIALIWNNESYIYLCPVLCKSDRYLGFNTKYMR